MLSMRLRVDVVDAIAGAAATCRMRLQLHAKLGATTVFGGSEELMMEHLAQREMPVLHGFLYEVRCSASAVPFSDRRNYGWCCGANALA